MGNPDLMALLGRSMGPNDKFAFQVLIWQDPAHIHGSLPEGTFVQPHFHRNATENPFIFLHLPFLMFGARTLR